MKNHIWRVGGIYDGKLVQELPITYLLWFVGSPLMRRSRWGQCMVALEEIRMRLYRGKHTVAAQLLSDLQPRPRKVISAIKARKLDYLKMKRRGT